MLKKTFEYLKISLNPAISQKNKAKLLPSIKKKDKQIEVLKNKIETLKNQNARLQAKINAKENQLMDFYLKKDDLKIIHLDNIPIDKKIDKNIQKVSEIYENEYGQEIAKYFSTHEKPRLSYMALALKKTKAASLLDVGVGQGVFINILALLKIFKKLDGIDIANHKYLINLGFNFILMDATKLKYPNNHFDVVVCMEVLEHLENDEEVPKIISELRRVASKKILITVPFNEQPLPDYHKRSFSENKIRELFPDGRLTLLYKQGTSWILIEEEGAVQSI